MSTFNRAVTIPRTAPITTTGATATSHQGGIGYARDTKSELFLLAASYLEGDKFYGNQEQRFHTLLEDQAVHAPEWTYQLIKWLRAEANLRSISLMAGIEFGRARLAAKAPELYCINGKFTTERRFSPVGINRMAVAASMKRADEPGEVIGYFIGKYGKRIPQYVKRGVADAASNLYNEFSYIKWDSQAASVRFADVLELCHVKNAMRNPLYKYILDQRHHNDGNTEGLPVLSRRAVLHAMPKDDRWRYLHESASAEYLSQAGMTWEQLSTWLGRPLRANEWARILPSMGLMAIIRNARNMDQAAVSDTDLQQVFTRLADAEQIKLSRMLPFRFLSAYRHSSLRWHYPLEQALRLSLANVPSLNGRTLILVDRSGSMFGPLSKKTDLNFADTAALFGAAIAVRAQNADLIQFGNWSSPVDYKKTDSPLQIVERFGDLGGTNTAQAVKAHYKGHDRVIILTDEQTSAYSSGPTAAVPANIPVYTWNLAGYQYGHGPSGSANRFTAGGLSDQSFSLIPILESASAGKYPWESQ